MLADSLEIMQETDWPPEGYGLLNVDSPEAYFKRIVEEMNAGEAAALNNLAAVVGSIQDSVDEDHPIYQYHTAVVGGNYSKMDQTEPTSDMTVEESQSQQPEWIAKLTESNNRPEFSGVRSTAQDIVGSSPERLHITVYDPYTGQTHEDTVKINTITETTIYCADEQVRLFKLPDGTTGHFNTQGGTDKMPDIVTTCEQKNQSER